MIAQITLMKAMCNALLKCVAHALAPENDCIFLKSPYNNY